MLNDIIEANDTAYARDQERRAEWARGDAHRRGREGIQGVFLDIVDNAQSKDFARECATLFRRKLNGEFSSEDWQAQMTLLDVAVRGIEASRKVAPVVS